MSRLANTIRNAKVGLFFHVLFITSQFIARKIFLDNLGDEFMGIVSTLGSFLTFINLAELGIGTAIGFTLYKPIFDKNYNEINNIIRFFGHIYKKIGFFILGGSVLLLVFFPLIFEGVSIDLWLVYFTFFGLLSSSLLGYFFNYHIFLLQADQKEYIIAKYFQSFNISKILLQAVFVFYFQSFVIWIILEVLSGLLYTILIRKKIKKEYPWLLLSSKVSIGRKQFDSYASLVQTIKHISIHKIGNFLVTGLDNILIFFFLSAELVAYFANYQLIIMNLISLVEKAFSGTKASLGNLVAENEPLKINQVFWELMVIRFFIAGIGGICIYQLINPFIALWLGEKYLLSDHVLIMFTLIFFLGQIVKPTEACKQAYGLYADIWAPIAKSVLNLLVSIILVQRIGMVGLLLGTFLSLLMIEFLWRPYYIYTKGFKRPHKEYIIGVAKLALTFLTAYIVIQFLHQKITVETPTFYGWILKALWVSSSSATIYGLILYGFNPYCRDVIKRFKNRLFK